jgi:predicted nucleic acid-binding Zn ribbon protein
VIKLSSKAPGENSPKKTTNPGEEFARAAFLSWRQSGGYRRSNRGNESKIDSDRIRLDDPKELSGSLAELIAERNWQAGLNTGNIFADWAELVGQEVATHCQPISMENGKLVIQTTATAWATQLKLLTPNLLTKLKLALPELNLSEISVIGPNSPSWRRGSRTIKNERGPRDTYG